MPQLFIAQKEHNRFQALFNGIKMGEIVKKTQPQNQFSL